MLEYTRENPVAPEISGYPLFAGERCAGRRDRTFSLYAWFLWRPKGIGAGIYIQEKTVAKLVYTGLIEDDAWMMEADYGTKRNRTSHLHKNDQLLKEKL